MSQLSLFTQFNMRKPYFVSSKLQDVAAYLASDQVRFEQWSLKHDQNTARCSEILSRYSSEIDRIKRETGLPNVELTVIRESDNCAISQRCQSLSEHTHTEPEVRFFLTGRALIYIHANERIHIVECTEGDFIVIPENVPHWFDMGPKPNYACLRWFNSKEGTEKHFTDNYIAESTPRWEGILREEDPREENTGIIELKDAI